MRPQLPAVLSHCVDTSSSNRLLKFADDMVVVMNLISNYTERPDLHKVDNLASWCQDNKFSLNLEKTKELVMDFVDSRKHFTVIVLSLCTR